MKRIITVVFVLLLFNCGQYPTIPLPGPKGDPGNKGDKGDTGNQGPQGIPGTSITIVQLCKNYTPHYPSVFPEVAFCIGGNLYAEYYSPPSSGLVYLPPGYYKSTQTNAPCNFTVVSGCVITE